MMKENYAVVYKAVKKQIQMVGSDIKFIIYPFGEIGAMVKGILNGIFNIQEAFIIDRDLAGIGDNIYSIEYLKNIECSQYFVLFSSNDDSSYYILRNNLKMYVQEENIIDIFPRTECGKYSYGPLCNHWLVKKVGAFSSFAAGTDVVENHPTQYISTHPFLYYGNAEFIDKEYDAYSKAEWFFPDVEPLGIINNCNKGAGGGGAKITIGNDVWLGKNVIITNCSDIGNGVIAAAGAVITKDVPDYAVVAGIPARIIRYRYSSEQIKQLNRIAWWNWPDEKIREFYNDFFIDIDDFIRKHR